MITGLPKMIAAWMKNPRVYVLSIIFSFLFLVLAVDRLMINQAFFLLPNELGWDTSPWYNFLQYNYQTKFSKSQQGVLVVGSSVALYSALPQEMEQQLNQKTKNKMNIRFFSHVAMSPTDFYYYTDRIIAKKPKTILYLINPADFQMDHLHPQPCPTKDCAKGRLVFSKKDWLMAYPYRDPTRMFYAFSFLRDHGSNLAKKSILKLASQSFLKINSYRKFFFDPIDALYERHIRRGRSYHTYTGILPQEGIWRQGWTKQDFSIDCQLDRGMLYQLVYITYPGTEVSVFFRQKQIYRKKFTKKGWVNLKIRLADAVDQALLSFHIDKPVASNRVNPRQYGKIYQYGIRLAQNFCRRQLQQDMSYQRGDFLDEHRFENMQLEEYREDYFARLYQDNALRPEVSRMNLLHIGKKQLADMRFQPWIEFSYLQKGVAKLLKNGIRVIIINNPENPLELQLYGSSEWYTGYLQFLANLSVESGYRFLDRKRFFSDPRFFIDPHHLTLPASRQMTREYVKVLQQ